MLATVIAAATRSDIWVLWVILALVAFGVAIWLTTRNQIVAAIVAAIIGVVLLVLAF